MSVEAVAQWVLRGNFPDILEEPTGRSLKVMGRPQLLYVLLLVGNSTARKTNGLKSEK